MKKSFLALLILIGLTGCRTQSDNPEKTTVPTIEPTPVSTVEALDKETPEVIKNEPEEKPEVESAGEGKDGEIIEEAQFASDTLTASYIEEISGSPTTLTFYADHHFETNLNICSGMSALTGSYTLEDQVVTLFFEEETGFSFLDGVEFRFDLLEDHRLVAQADTEMFSCAGSSPESYQLRK